MKHFIIWDDTNTGFKPGGAFSTEYVPTLRAGRFGIKVIETDKVLIPQATKQGNIECELGGGGGLGLP